MTADTDRRWEQYRRANTQRPSARERELRQMYRFINPHEGERIWEAGTGNGYLTFPLAEAVGRRGLVLTTDVERGNIEEVHRKAAEQDAPIEALLLTPENPFLNHVLEFDTVASIATFHHFDNRTQKTGWQGRERALKAFYDALKPGGRLILADVLHGTPTQVYFDAIDNPEYCHPYGHPHNFPTAPELKAAMYRAGFTNMKLYVRPVPWQFENKNEAQTFVHTIHNAQCSPEESLALAEKILGLQECDRGYELGWQLFFLIAKK